MFLLLLLSLPQKHFVSLSFNQNLKIPIRPFTKVYIESRSHINRLLLKTISKALLWLFNSETLGLDKLVFKKLQSRMLWKFHYHMKTFNILELSKVMCVYNPTNRAVLQTWKLCTVPARLRVESLSQSPPSFQSKNNWCNVSLLADVSTSKMTGSVCIADFHNERIIRESVKYSRTYLCVSNNPIKPLKCSFICSLCVESLHI